MQKQEKRQRINVIDPRSPYIYIIITQDAEKLLRIKSETKILDTKALVSTT